MNCKLQLIDIFHMDIETTTTNSGDNKLSVFVVNEKLKAINRVLMMFQDSLRIMLLK